MRAFYWFLRLIGMMDLFVGGVGLAFHLLMDAKEFPGWIWSALFSGLVLLGIGFLGDSILSLHDDLRKNQNKNH